MFDFIKGLFIWFFKKILVFFFPVVGWIVFFFENFSGTIKSIWNYFISWLDWFFQDFYTWLFEQFSSELITLFNENEFIVSVVELTDSTFTLINVFLPLNEACACLTFIVGTMTFVFVLRIALKAIPTIW